MRSRSNGTEQAEPKTGFRTVLRNATKQSHDRLDNAMSVLDIAQPDDFLSFCQIHVHAFSALSRAQMHPMLEAMIPALCADIDVLGGAVPAPPEADLAPVTPLAMEYILHGSRMGTQVLRRRWQQSEDRVVQRASAYFSLPYDTSAWRALCTELDAVPAEGFIAERIKTEAIQLFDVFWHSTDALRSKVSSGL